MVNQFANLIFSPSVQNVLTITLAENQQLFLLALKRYLISVREICSDFNKNNFWKLYIYHNYYNSY
jgi:hypothetical protein